MNFRINLFRGVAGSLGIDVWSLATIVYRFLRLPGAQTIFWRRSSRHFRFNIIAPLNFFPTPFFPVPCSSGWKTQTSVYTLMHKKRPTYVWACGTAEPEVESQKKFSQLSSGAPQRFRYCQVFLIMGKTFRPHLTTWRAKNATLTSFIFLCANSPMYSLCSLLSL